MPAFARNPRQLGSGSFVTTEANGELLVYDPNSHHLHHLNPVAAAVWNLCDGTRDVDAILRETAATLGQPVAEPEVRLALELLANASLIDVGGYAPARRSRRSFVRKAAIGGAMLPAIVSTTAPAAAQGGSPTCDAVDDPVGPNDCTTAPSNRCCQAATNCLGYCSDSICNPTWGSGTACQPI